MSETPMMYPASEEMVEHYALNAGMLMQNVVLDGITSAEEFVAYVRDNSAQLLGATTGNTTITENRETWEPERNGKRTPAKGEKYYASSDPTIKATLLEMTPNNVKLASGAADITGDGTSIVKITPRAEFKAGDYLTNVAWFTNYGKKGIILAVLKNAICTKGTSWSIDDKKVATCEVEFHGHADNVLFDDSLPIEYYVLYNAQAEE